MKKLLLSGIILACVSGIAQATVMEVSAFETGSMSANRIWNDDRLRAYYSDSVGNIDGFMQFDLSALDDNASISSITLTTFHEYGYGNPLNDPQVSIYHVTNDAWSRGSNHPGINESISDIYSGFPSTSNTSFEWVLDPLAFDWAADIQDNLLSLAMHNELNSYNYVYWHGSDNQLYAPKITIEYSIESIPEPAFFSLLGLGLIGLGYVRNRK